MDGAPEWDIKPSGTDVRQTADDLVDAFDQEAVEVAMDYLLRAMAKAPTGSARCAKPAVRWCKICCPATVTKSLLAVTIRLPNAKQRARRSA